MGVRIVGGRLNKYFFNYLRNWAIIPFIVRFRTYLGPY